MVYECKVATIWSIKRDTFMKIIDDDLYSKTIQTTVDGYEYHFEIRKRDDDVAIFITDEQDLDKTNIKSLTLSIPSADFEADLSNDADVPEDNHFHGWENTVVLKYEDILDPDNQYFVDDILTLKFHGIIEYTEKPKPKSLNEMLWDSEEDKDFRFIIQNDDDIKGHKFILRRYSTVFAKIFDANINQIEVKDFDYNTVYYVLRLCYDFPCEADFDELLDCLRFTDVYEMSVIKQRIGHRLSDEIDPKNVCELANKSIELKCSTLKGYCITFILKCIKDCTPYDGALDLKTEIMQDLYKSSICYTETS